MHAEHEALALDKIDTDLMAANARIKHQLTRLHAIAREGGDLELAMKVLTVLRNGRDATMQRRECVLEQIELMQMRARRRDRR